MRRYRKKREPEVEAVQWTGENREEIEAFVGDKADATFNATTISLWTGTALEDDWVIKDADGALSIRSPKTFQATYEPVEEGGGEGHRLRIEFGGGLVRYRLAHPEGGECNPATTCAVCAADLTDPNSKRCYDCPPAPNEECWLTAWVEEQGEELLEGSIEFPVEAEWNSSYEHPRIRIAARPQLSTEEGGEATFVVDGQRLDANGVNEHGVAMCKCKPFGPVHAWEPGEWCGDRVVPQPATPEPEEGSG